jgi:hypothetical protein
MDITAAVTAAPAHENSFVRIAAVAEEKLRNGATRLVCRRGARPGECAFRE